MVKMHLKRKSLITIVGILLGVSVSIAGCSEHNLTNSSSANSGSQPELSIKYNKSYGGLSESQYSDLANKEFHNKTYGFINVNGGKSTLNPKSWKTNKVIYQKLDKLNRTSSSNVGFLEKRNLADDSLRVRQYIEPTGWHYNHGSNQIYNRGHLIAYSVSAGIDQSGKYNPHNTSGDQNNPKNLFTQTAYSNQQLQTIYESKIRNALRANKKVIFEATPIFRGNEKMARGINLQAISTDNSLNFNVYIYNVQPGYRFNYMTGRVKVDRNVIIKALPANLQSLYRNQSNNYKQKGSFLTGDNAFNYNKDRNGRQARNDTEHFVKRQFDDLKHGFKGDYHHHHQGFKNRRKGYYRQKVNDFYDDIKSWVHEQDEKQR